MERNVMNAERGEPPDSQLLFLQELIAEHACIAGDVVEIGPHTWAIHGSIAVDGDVIVAEFNRPDEAKAVLDRLGPDLPNR
jgi:hypothetical protein